MKQKKKKQQPTTGCTISMCAFVFKKQNKKRRKLYMMTCFTGSNYSDTEESRKKKRTPYFIIMLLSSEMYFDVHYDYSTSLRHPWYMSGFVLFRKKKEKRKRKNGQKKTKKKTVTPFQLCAHSVCTVSAAHHHPTGCEISSGGAGLQGSSRRGRGARSSHVISMYSSEVLLLKHYHHV